MGQSESKQEWQPTPSKFKQKSKVDGDTHLLNDWGCLDRFLCLGTRSSYNYHDKHPQRENADCIERLIKSGEGTEVVDHLLRLSQCGSTLRQNYLIFALAICARSNDDDTKKEAYKHLNQICRIPTHFFLFVNYCKQESLQTRSKGWGRAHRRAMVKWYEEKSKDPVGLGRHLSKYKARKMQTDDGKGEIWSHKDVLKMAHVNWEDNLMKIVTKYVLFSFKEAMSLASSSKMNSEDVTKFLSYIEGTERAKRCYDEKELAELIKEFNLEREHIPTQLMNSKIVCEAIAANMKAEAKIRNISLMASKGLCDAGSEYERQITEILDNEQALHAAKIHPFRILIALKAFKKGAKIEKTRSKNGKVSIRHLKWNVNDNICQKLENAFYLSFQNVDACGKRFLLAVSVSEDMAKPCQGCPSINCQEASAAMAMLTVKTEGKGKVVVFSNGLTKVDIKKEDSLAKVTEKFDKFKGSDADPCLPVLWAMEKKKKYDVFIVYSTNPTTKGHQVTEVMKKYQKEMKIPDARMIVVAMLANKTIIADERDSFIFNIVGFDNFAAQLIQKIAASEI